MVRSFIVFMIAVQVLTLCGVSLAAERRAPLPIDPVARALTPAMAGEFALQAGRLDESTRWYLEAAEADPSNAALAARATRIAMLAYDNAASERALRLWRQNAPHSLNMRGAEAALSLRQGKARQARRQLTALLQNPDSRGWQFALLALIGGRDIQLSTRVLRDLVDAGAIPDDLAAWQEFGQLALRMEDPKLAGRIIDQVVARFPNEPGVVLLRASQLQMVGKEDEARTILAPLKVLAAADNDIRRLLVMSYESLGDYADGAQVMAMGPQNTLTYSIRASLLARAEDTKSLAVLYEDLRRESVAPDADRRLLMGKIAEFLKRPEEAVTWYRSIERGEQRTEARLRTASILYETGRKEEAFQEVRALQSNASIDDDGRRGAYLMEADLYRQDNDVAAEMDVLARGLAAYPDDEALLYARALAWERQDRIDHAEADFRKILISDPENVAVLNALGYTLADRTDRYQEALELISRARAAEPDNGAIVDSYGWVLYRLGRYDEAVLELRRAWRLMRDPEVAAHLGEVLWVMGQKDEARRYLEESQKLEPDNRALRRVLETIGVVLEQGQ
jgi:predicted Zn-dependent protease